MAPDGELDIKVSLSINELRKAINEMEKSMATLSANTEDQEEFSLSGLDYDELLETYGDDPVLMTIFNRMKDFFSRSGEDKWFRFKDWPKGGSASDPSKYLRWDIKTGTTSTTLDTTSVVSDTFTVKFDDTTGKGMVVKDSVSYSIDIE